MAGVLLMACGVAAAANWWCRLTHWRMLEWITKPLVTVLVITAALAIDPADGPQRTWFVVAFVGCLAGDVFLMLPESFFLAGLACFLVGHFAFIIGLVTGPGNHLALGAIAVVLVMAGLALVGRKIVIAATSENPTLKVPVSAYLVAISIMVMVGWRTGNGWALAGSSAFFVSDAILGWDAFVAKMRWASVAIMATYHAALVGLLLALI